MMFIIRFLISSVLCFFLSANISLAVNNKDKLEARDSIMSLKATESILTGITSIGGKTVAVGDRGHIVLSTDNGESWSQARVPVRDMLTSVTFPTSEKGWAVGHHGLILNTIDGGVSWKIQYADPYIEGAAEDEDDYLAISRSGFPLLDVWFKNEKEGFAVGAYGFFLHTDDAGKTWQDWSEKIENEEGWHLNAIASRDGKCIYIVGESGMMFRSDDGGQTWITLNSNYEGAYFGVLIGLDNDVSAFGMQGKIFKSIDRGENWHEVFSNCSEALMRAAWLNGNIVIVGTAGVVLVSKDNGDTYSKTTILNRAYIVDISVSDVQTLQIASSTGVHSVKGDTLLAKVNK